MAQREGRAKDGICRTEPVIIKMFALAYRKELETLADWLEGAALVPVSLSYEIDRCAPIKVRELYLRAEQGDHERSESEDRDSILRGISVTKAASVSHSGSASTMKMRMPKGSRLLVFERLSAI